MSDRELVLVTGKQGLRGWIQPDDERSLNDRNEVVVRFDDGERVSVSSDLLERQADEGYFLPLSRTELREMQAQQENESLVIPLAEEELHVSKRKVTTGKVRLIKNVETREEVIDEPTIRESVDIRRVEKNEVLDGPAEVRYEDGTMIIPVMEEELVISKRLVLKEEIHVTKRREESRREQHVTLRNEKIRVERDADTSPFSSGRGEQ